MYNKLSCEFQNPTAQISFETLLIKIDSLKVKINIFHTLVINFESFIRHVFIIFEPYVVILIVGFASCTVQSYLVTGVSDVNAR